MSVDVQIDQICY